MGNWNEEPIKRAIVQGRKDGICDKNGHTIRYHDGSTPTPKGRRQHDAGKGDAPRPVDKKKYDKTFVKVFGEKMYNLWPRDKNGKLIGA